MISISNCKQIINSLLNFAFNEYKKPRFKFRIGIRMNRGLGVGLLTFYFPDQS
jgi:hypothetical protein